MFGSLKLLGELGKIEEKLKKARERIANLEVRIRVAEGQVELIMDGFKRIRRLTLHEEIKQKPAEEIARLIHEAFNEASTTVEQQVVLILQEELGSLLENVPGLDARMLLPGLTSPTEKPN